MKSKMYTWFAALLCDFALPEIVILFALIIPGNPALSNKCAINELIASFVHRAKKNSRKLYRDLGCLTSERSQGRKD
jgi:hypothetical protein